jgi:hypothetical protein
MAQTTHPENRPRKRPHPSSRKARHALVQHRLSGDPYAITAPVDPTYRHRVSERAYIARRPEDVYADLMPLTPEEDE